MSGIEFLTGNYPPALPNWLQPTVQSVHDSLGSLQSRSRFRLNLYRWRSVLPNGPIEIPNEKDLTLPWMYALVGAIHDASKREPGTGSFGKRMMVSPWSERGVKDVGTIATYEDFKRGYEFLCLQVRWVYGLKDADRDVVERVQHCVKADLLIHRILDGPNDIKLSDERCEHLERALDISVLVESLSSDELNRLKTILDRNRPWAETAPAASLKEFEFRRDGDGYTIRGFGEGGHVDEMVGFEYILRILQSPEKRISMAELVGTDDRIEADARSRQPAFDKDAKRKLAEELKRLRAALSAAKENNDIGEQERLQLEIEQLTDLANASFGIRGKDRDLNNPIDKLRPRIHVAISRACKKLEAREMPKLSEHFNLSFPSESGFFVYRPAGLNPDWIVE